ncbi:MAG: F0F1-type ATP synthase membrane subunit b/b' [Oleispira sp.]|jgi:F0F1-type ATP synthase membrane subunit b/b'
MERLIDDMARLQEDVKSRVSITSTQLAEFKLSRASDTARDSRERAMFVVENSLSVNRMLKKFHNSRIANGLQDRADRIAFVSDMVKKRAEFLEKLSATRNGSLKDIANESAAKIADNATSVAALIKEGTGHTYGDATGRLAATKTSEPAIDADVVTAEVNARLLNTQIAIPPSTATKTTVSVAPKTAASVAPKAAEPITPEAAAPVTPKAGVHVTPKASAPKRVKSKRNC